jgi:Uma2 family endonuclease
MATTILTGNQAARYRGLRMTADEHLGLEDDGCCYERVDGVVCTSPRPTPSHQEITPEIGSQIRNHVARRRCGRVFVEVDVRLKDGLVYRPDAVFLSTAKAAGLSRYTSRRRTRA